MWLRSISTLLFAFVMLSGPAGAGTILIWGDSLSAGYGLRPKEDWPTLLQTRLTEKGFPHVVINASVSGETSSGGRTRLPTALEQTNPDLLVLELGANDGLRGLPPKLLADNLTAMIDDAKQAGVEVLLVGMQMPPNFGPAYTQRFAQTFADVASKAEVALLPFLLDGFADQPERFQQDGIHPTAEAQYLILETVWNRLLPMLESANP